MRSRTHRLSDRVAPFPRLVSNVYGRARQQPPPRVDWELRVYNSIALGDSGPCRLMYVDIIVIEITRNLVLDIGATQEQYERWIDMEMEEFLVILQCRR